MTGSGDRDLPQRNAPIIGRYVMGNQHGQPSLLELLLYSDQQNLILANAAGEHDLGELVLVSK